MGNSASEVPPPLELPIDDEGFVQSFAADDADGIAAFFDEYGFVVVRDIIDGDACEATIDEIWTYIETRGFVPAVFRNAAEGPDRHDPSTWVNAKWPGMREEGIVGSSSIFLPQALRNRASPALHRVYAGLLGREDVCANHDRFGFFRPTRGVDYVDAEGNEQHLDDPHKNWTTIENVHFDANIWTYVTAENSDQGKKLLNSLRYERVSDFIQENNQIGVLAEGETHIQGLINLADNREDDGGFHCVPGCHKYIEDIARATADTIGTWYGPLQSFIVIPEGHLLCERAVRITARAGSAILWSQNVAHGSKPNRSSRPRFAQFLKMFPADFGAKRFVARQEAVATRVARAGVEDEFDETQRKVLGLDPWHPEAIEAELAEVAGGPDDNEAGA